jgi:hypothetical protein
MKPSQKHSDAIFYEMAAEEVQKGVIDKGLMAKAAVKSGGDKRKAEVLYIEWRVALLKEQADQDRKRQIKQAEEERNSKVHTPLPSLGWVYVILVILGLIVAFTVWFRD